MEKEILEQLQRLLSEQQEAKRRRDEAQGEFTRLFHEVQQNLRNLGLGEGVHLIGDYAVYRDHSRGVFVVESLIDHR